MKEKTYRKITKKRPFRGVKRFKQKYLTKSRLCFFLAKIRILKIVEYHTSIRLSPSQLCDGEIHVCSDKIITPRGKFNLSYRSDGIETSDHLHYEIHFFGRKKIVYVEKDSKVINIRVTVHSECEEFLVKINPFTECNVNRNSPYAYVVYTENSYANLLARSESVEYKKIHVDFFNARFAVGVSLDTTTKESVESCLKECLMKARNQIEGYITSNYALINERLVGVKNDGEIVAPDGSQLLHNNICRRCGRPVFKSKVEGYTAQCIVCDEDFYSFEVSRVDPNFYEKVYKNTKEELYYLSQSKI